MKNITWVLFIIICFSSCKRPQNTINLLQSNAGLKSNMPDLSYLNFDSLKLVHSIEEHIIDGAKNLDIFLIHGVREKGLNYYDRTIKLILANLLKDPSISKKDTVTYKIINQVSDAQRCIDSLPWRSDFFDKKKIYFEFKQGLSKPKLKNDTLWRHGLESLKKFESINFITYHWGDITLEKKKKLFLKINFDEIVNEEVGERNYDLAKNEINKVIQGNDSSIYNIDSLYKKYKEKLQQKRIAKDLQHKFLTEIFGDFAYYASFDTNEIYKNLKDYIKCDVSKNITLAITGSLGSVMMLDILKDKDDKLNNFKNKFKSLYITNNVFPFYNNLRTNSDRLFENVDSIFVEDINKINNLYGNIPSKLNIVSFYDPNDILGYPMLEFKNRFKNVSLLNFCLPNNLFEVKLDKDKLIKLGYAVPLVGSNIGNSIENFADIDQDKLKFTLAFEQYNENSAFNAQLVNIIAQTTPKNVYENVDIRFQNKTSHNNDSSKIKFNCPLPRLIGFKNYLPSSKPKKHPKLPTKEDTTTFSNNDRTKSINETIDTLNQFEFDGIDDILKKNTDVNLILIHGMRTKKFNYFDRTEQQLAEKLDFYSKPDTVFTREVNQCMVKTSKYKKLVGATITYLNIKSIVWSGLTHTRKDYLLNKRNIDKQQKHVFASLLKKQLFQDGFIDAVCMGSSDTSYIDDIKNTLTYCLKGFNNVQDKNTLIISGSLGSNITYQYLLDNLIFDKKASDDLKKRIKNIHTVYMMTNQIELFDFRMNNRLDPDSVPDIKHIFEDYEKINLIAFNDENDILSYKLYKDPIDEVLFKIKNLDYTIVNELKFKYPKIKKILEHYDDLLNFNKIARYYYKHTEYGLDKEWYKEKFSSLNNFITKPEHIINGDEVEMILRYDVAHEIVFNEDNLLNYVCFGNKRKKYWDEIEKKNEFDSLIVVTTSQRNVNDKYYYSSIKNEKIVIKYNYNIEQNSIKIYSKGETNDSLIIKEVKKQIKDVEFADLEKTFLKILEDKAYEIIKNRKYNYIRYDVASLKFIQTYKDSLEAKKFIYYDIPTSTIDENLKSNWNYSDKILYISNHKIDENGYMEKDSIQKHFFNYNIDNNIQSCYDEWEESIKFFIKVNDGALLLINNNNYIEEDKKFNKLIYTSNGDCYNLNLEYEYMSFDSISENVFLGKKSSEKDFIVDTYKADSLSTMETNGNYGKLSTNELKLDFNEYIESFKVFPIENDYIFGFELNTNFHWNWNWDSDSDSQKDSDFKWPIENEEESIRLVICKPNE